MGSALGGLLGGGGGGGGGSKTTSNSQTRVDMPAWLLAPQQKIVSSTMDLFNRPYEGYEGQRVANFTADEQNSFDMVRGLTGQANPYLDTAMNRNMYGYSSQDLQGFMNPYQENVLDIQKRRALESYDQQKKQMEQRAGSTASFGGSRFGLQSAQMSKNIQQQLADSEMLGLANNYSQGLNAAMAGTNMAANQALQKQQQGYTDATYLNTQGGQQRGLNQANLDVSYGDFLDRQQHPYSQIEFASGVVNPIAQLNAGSTTNQTSTTEQTKSKTSGLQKALGIAALVAAPFTGGASLGLSGLGAAGAAGGLGGFAGLSSGLGSLAGSFGMNTAFNTLINPSQGFGSNIAWNSARFAEGGLVKTNGGIFDRIAQALNIAAQPDDESSVQAWFDLYASDAVKADIKNQAKNRPDIQDLDYATRLEELKKEFMQSQMQSREIEQNPPYEMPSEGDLPSSKNLDGYSPQDRDILIRAMFGEGRSEDPEGQAAIAHVILNRAKGAGASLKDVITTPKQISAFNEGDPNREKLMNLSTNDPRYEALGRIADGVLSGQIQDPTGGADHYFNPSVVAPAWSSSMEDIKDIGAHRFGRIGNYNVASGPKGYAEGGRVNNPFEQYLLNMMDTAKPVAGYIHDNPVKAAGIGLSVVPWLGTASKVGTAGAGLAAKYGAGPVKSLVNAGMKNPKVASTLAGLGLIAGSRPEKAPEDPLLTRAIDNLQNGTQAGRVQNQMDSAGKFGKMLAAEEVAKNQTQQDVLKRMVSTSSQNSSTPLPNTKPAEEKKGGVNKSLWAFGEALLKGTPLGDAASAVSSQWEKDELKIMSREKAIQEAAQQQFENSLNQYKAQAYGRQVDNSVAKGNDPYSIAKKRLELQIMQRKLDQGPKMEQDLVKAMVSTGALDPSNPEQLAKVLSGIRQGTAGDIPTEAPQDEQSLGNMTPEELYFQLQQMQQ